MNYTANDIQTLDFRTAIRSRIAMYMGSADNQGVLQFLYKECKQCVICKQ